MDFSYASFSNLETLERFYELFLNKPDELDQNWRHYFEGFALADVSFAKSIDAEQYDDLRIFKLIEAYRTYGHLLAKIDPLAEVYDRNVIELKIESMGFTSEDLTKEFSTFNLLEQKKAQLNDIIKVLHQIYCGTIGFEYMGDQSKELEKWIQSEIEPNRGRPRFSNEKKQEILHQLSKAELFEMFLHIKYVGQKRFSLEGGETLIPILCEIISLGPDLGIDDLVIGMPHRGRLNVLTNILNKPYEQVFAEFEDKYEDKRELGVGADVKYHRGFSADIIVKTNHNLHISLTANPSHLESVDPVVQGIVRAKQEFKKDIHRKKTIPILIHGDASIAGQGEVYECMQLYKLKGFTTGGTIHIVVNNQIGFTTLPQDARSTQYCTDLSRTFSAPVFHVNAEDPEGCVYATQLAVRLRDKFACDVFIDLNCYRKYGHNEGDEPLFTQPHQYQLIKLKKNIRDIYLQKLLDESSLTKQTIAILEQKFNEALHNSLESIKNHPVKYKEETLKGVWEKFVAPTEQQIFSEYKTAVSIDKLRAVANEFCTLPQDFSPHTKIAKLIEDRLKTVNLDPQVARIDWGLAEHLAFGSLLDEGYSIRFSGQDCQRGTFSHRHAIIVDQKKNAHYIPLAHLNNKTATFEIYNSPLSEFAVLGFEFGYSLAYPQTLTIWEAQFGDFANGAQVIIDQYIVSTEQKWARFSGIVLYLPHGYEGQGPEHSSGRIERFLLQTSDNNIQVVNPTTSAQLFHLLRRQMIRPFRKPLIIFTPKGLLRYPDALSPLIDLTQKNFEEVIDETITNREASRVIFCSGKIFYDLIKEREKRQVSNDAIIRIEQLYPWPKDKVIKILTNYPKAQSFLWVQEEPLNMGAWEFVRHFLSSLVSHPLKVIARKRSAAPATGSHFIHQKEQIDLMERIFNSHET